MPSVKSCRNIFLIVSRTTFAIIWLADGCRGFYLPITRMDIERTAPNGRLANGTLVAEVPVLLFSGRPMPRTTNFTLTEIHYFSINEKGEIRVKRDIISEPEANFYMHAIARVPYIPTTVSVEIKIKIVGSNGSRCQSPQAMCFAGSIEFQVHLDAKGLTDEVPLGRIGQTNYECGNRIEYALDPGEKRVTLKGGTLFAKMSSLEAETGRFNVMVSCLVDGRFTIKSPFSVTTIRKTSAELIARRKLLLDSPTALKGEGFILAWAFFKEGTHAELAKGQNNSLYSLSIDRNEISSIFASRILILINLKWTETHNVSRPMKIAVTMKVKEPGFPKEEVNLSVNLLPPNGLHLPKEALSYEKPITVMRGLGPLARVATPADIRNLWSDAGNNFTISNVTFRSVLPSDLTSPFNVTPSAGIIYLTEKWLEFDRNFPNFTGVLIELRLKNELVRIAWVPVRWDEETDDCHQYQFIFNRDSHSDFICSGKRTQETCQYTCGIGASPSFGGSCFWNKPSNSVMYSTCTTDRNFCPDEWCDPLEELDVHLCPQDCTRKVYAGHLNPNNRGIRKSTTGICSCSIFGECTCGPAVPAVRLPRRKPRKDVTKASCDGSCIVLLLVAGSGIGVIVGGIIALIFKKTRPSCAKNKSAMNFNIAYGGDSLILSEMALMDHNQRIEIDEKWETPRDSLTVEECLGEGEFGRVLKATAKDLRNLPGYTTVAVKTLKDSAGSAELADLLSEYQLLKKVDHRNVIKLLGACTTPEGPVYIIIEYCALGSLRAYLRLHKNLKTNADMGAKVPENSLITPKDMMSFAYQISKGMAYLSDIKLVHRDLAARNILLAEEKICKISDFGLTRDVYEDDTYLKQSKGRVPVKWMAIESLGEHIYTSQSDVWSFGIVLWELVTLGASPYPEVAVQNLYHLLKNGYRMQRPLNCSKELYEIMRKCWDLDPDARPSFSSLVDQFGRMLEKGLDYVNFSIKMISNPVYFNPEDIQDEDAHEMQITFKMELKSLTRNSINNNLYENHSVTPNTSYDTPRTPQQIKLIQSAT